MIIFGTTTLNLKRGEGDFFCPVCYGQQEFTRRVAREFFTLYFIPVIPLGAHGEFVQCRRCKQQFDLNILTYDPAAEKQASYETFRRVILLSMLSTERVTQPHLDAMRDTLHSTFCEVVSDEQIMDDLEQAESVDAQLIPYARRAGAELTPESRVVLLRCVSEVLAANSDFGVQDQQLLLELGEVFGMQADEVSTLWEGQPPVASS